MHVVTRGPARHKTRWCPFPAPQVQSPTLVDYERLADPERASLSAQVSYQRGQEL